MHLEQKVAAVFTQATIDAAPYETIKLLATSADHSTDGRHGAASLIRHDGGNWLVDGFVVGKRIQIDGRRRLLDGRRHVRRRRGRASSSGWRSSRSGRRSGRRVHAASTPRDVRSVARIVTAGDVPVVADRADHDRRRRDYGGYVTRTDGCNWADFGFMEGQQVRIQGLDGSWRVRRIEDGPAGVRRQGGCVLRLERGLALPTISIARDPDGLLARPARRPHRRPRWRQQPAEDQLPARDDRQRPTGHRHGVAVRTVARGSTAGSTSAIASRSAAPGRSRGPSSRSSTAPARRRTRSRVAASTRR